MLNENGPVTNPSGYTSIHRGTIIKFTYNFHFLENRITSLYQTQITLFHTIPGGRLNKKDGLTRYGNSHVKDKTS